MGIVHYIAHQQVRRFVELFWDELPACWTETAGQTEFQQFQMEVYLAAFDLSYREQRWDRFALLRESRKRAETYYQQEFRLVHHTPLDWAHFRFWLERALLTTAGADGTTLLHCYEYHDITAGFAHRISHQGRERPAKTLNP